MRLATYATSSAPRLGIVVGPPDDPRVLDVAGLGAGLPGSMDELLAGDADALLAAVGAAARAHDGREAARLREVRLEAPIERPGKIIAVGRNYREHAAEEGADAAPEPILFTKYSSSITGPDREIRWRAALTAEVDYEAELAVVIGRRTRDVPPERALEAVLGYTCLNDVSARDLQRRDGQWVRAKSLDGFCPMGPWLVTRDEVPDPQALSIRCIVNGETRQDASTGDMIHGVAALIATCSAYFTLEPGDVIATGTPGGVGAFRTPPVFLGDGDLMRVVIDGIGALENRCRVLPA
jgi:2-keto-4-pentenoate hydratase/2-oxohepta-3-ene-1,7-dioic acid hydratase in catechol pathway